MDDVTRPKAVALGKTIPYELPKTRLNSKRTLSKPRPRLALQSRRALQRGRGGGEAHDADVLGPARLREGDGPAV